MRKRKPIESNLAADHLRAAEKHIEIAIGKIGKHAGGGPPKSYIGSLREYRNLVKLFLRLRSITEDVDRGEKRMM